MRQNLESKSTCKQIRKQGYIGFTVCIKKKIELIGFYFRARTCEFKRLCSKAMKFRSHHFGKKSTWALGGVIVTKWVYFASGMQAAAACTLKNISAAPEVRQTLAKEGIVKVIINLLDRGILLGSKEYAAECLLNLTSASDILRRCVVAEGGIQSLLIYLDSPLPQESVVGTLRNLVGSVSEDVLISHGLLPILVHALKSESLGAQQAATSAICQIYSSVEMKIMIGEAGCISLLIKMLEAKSNSNREVAAPALSSLVSLSHNCREVRRDLKSVPNLVQLLDPSPQNTAQKYAVTCLALLYSSKKCKKLMISYGAIGYLKKLTEMDIPGTQKLLERLERGKLRSLFSRK